MRRGKNDQKQPVKLAEYASETGELYNPLVLRNRSYCETVQFT